MKVNNLPYQCKNISQCRITYPSGETISSEDVSYRKNAIAKLNKARSSAYKNLHRYTDTTQKMKCFIKDFFTKCDEIRRKLLIWSYLLKKSSMDSLV